MSNLFGFWKVIRYQSRHFRWGRSQVVIYFRERHNWNQCLEARQITGSPFELAESENLQEPSSLAAGEAESLRQLVCPQPGEWWGSSCSWPKRGEGAQRGDGFGGPGWLSPSGEGRRAREEWGPFIWFFTTEDFEFPERVFWQEILNLVTLDGLGCAKSKGG